MTQAKFSIKDDELYFSLVSPSIADHKAVPFEFEGPATKDHLKHYGPALEEWAAACGFWPSAVEREAAFAKVIADAELDPSKPRTARFTLKALGVKPQGGESPKAEKEVA